MVSKMTNRQVSDHLIVNAELVNNFFVFHLVIHIDCFLCA